MADRAASPARPEETAIFRAVADVSPLLWEDVEARTPAEAARSAGGRLGPGRRVTLPFMGGDYLVDFEARDITAPAGHRPAGFQKALVLLSYLAHAQDLGLSGRLVTSRELNGGEMFFKGPHALLTRPVTDKFGTDPAGFTARAGQLGLAPDGGAGSGAAVRGRPLPHLEVGLILHAGDDEFPAALTYTFDAYAHHHLPLDALWSLINVLAEELAA